MSVSSRKELILGRTKYAQDLIGIDTSFLSSGFLVLKFSNDDAARSTANVLNANSSNLKLHLSKCGQYIMVYMKPVPNTELEPDHAAQRWNEEQKKEEAKKNNNIPGDLIALQAEILSLLEKTPTFSVIEQADFWQPFFEISLKTVRRVTHPISKVTHHKMVEFFKSQCPLPFREQYKKYLEPASAPVASSQARLLQQMGSPRSTETRRRAQVLKNLNTDTVLQIAKRAHVNSENATKVSELFTAHSNLIAAQFMP